MKRVASCLCTPAYRKCIPSVVFPHPGSPRTRYERRGSNPPCRISSSSVTPVDTRTATERPSCMDSDRFVRLCCSIVEARLVKVSLLFDFIHTHPLVQVIYSRPHLSDYAADGPSCAAERRYRKVCQYGPNNRQPWRAQLHPKKYEL